MVLHVSLPFLFFFSLEQYNIRRTKTQKTSHTIEKHNQQIRIGSFILLCRLGFLLRWLRHYDGRKEQDFQVLLSWSLFHCPRQLLYVSALPKTFETVSSNPFFPFVTTANLHFVVNILTLFAFFIYVAGSYCRGYCFRLLLLSLRFGL